MKPTASQAVEIVGHFHWLIRLSFLVGYSMAILAQITLIVSSKDNPFTSYWVVFKQNIPKLIVRIFICYIFFAGFWYHPDLFPLIIGYIPGITLSQGVIAFLMLPMTPIVAAGLGFVSDFAVSMIPKLKNILPPVAYVRRVTDKVTREHSELQVAASDGAPTAETTTRKMVEETVTTKPQGES